MTQTTVQLETVSVMDKWGSTMTAPLQSEGLTNFTLTSLHQWCLIFSLFRMCFANGTHVQKTCGEGEIVYINTVTHDWMCGIDDGRCPGAFQVGCDPDPDYSTVPPPPPINFCNQTKNPLGDCECGDQNQLWINDDCHQVRKLGKSQKN